MKFQFLGTAAAEGMPAVFCRCETCEKARALKGKNIRSRAQALINDDLLLDFSSDTYWHAVQNGLYLDKVKYIYEIYGQLSTIKKIVEKAIEGAANWISSDYIHSSKYHQNTLYKMRFNYDYVWHQYATDVNWANGIAGVMYKIANMYDTSDNLTFEIPDYK